MDLYTKKGRPPQVSRNTVYSKSGKASVESRVKRSMTPVGATSGPSSTGVLSIARRTRPESVLRCLREGAPRLPAATVPLLASGVKSPTSRTEAELPNAIFRRGPNIDSTRQSMGSVEVEEQL